MVYKKFRLLVSRNFEDMVTSRDIEKGFIDVVYHGFDRALHGTKNEGIPDDGEHPNRAHDMELVDFKKPCASSSNIANGDVNAEESKQIEESNVEGTIESKASQDGLQKLWDMNTSLLDAIATHNNKDVISLLKSGANPNATCLKTLKSACHIAAISNEEALRILLDADAERWRRDFKGNNPLHYAACSNAPKKIAMILGFPEGLTNAVAKVNCTLTQEQEVKIQQIGARDKRYLDSTETMGPHASDLPDQWRTNNGSHYFHYLHMMPGHSALHVASASAYPSCVRLLLVAGANPNILDNNNSTPLDVAGTSRSTSDVQSYVETLQLLREYGGSLSRDEQRVLETALRKRSLQALTLLLDAGAPINHRNPSGYTPLHLCVELRLKEHLEVLANYNRPEMDYRAVDVTDTEGSTVLHWAARECWADGVTVALLARADITHKNSVGDTALHLAAKASDYDIVKQIIDHDTNGECDFIKENVKGECPFSNAIISGNVDIVRLMLAKNNELRVYLHRKVGDLTPLEYAAERKFQKLFIFILKEIIYPITLGEVERIVHNIARNNHWELISELYSLIDDMNNVISKKHILHEAIEHNSRETVSVLLENGADLSQKNKDNQTAISLLMYHVTKPTEFMTEVLDKCIKADKNIYNKDYVVTINYSILKPVSEYVKKSDGRFEPLNTKARDMNVLEALTETGDVYDQRSLLTHPVVESFLYLKWKQCAKFIYVLISVYVLFLISLNTFIATIYYHMDHKIDEQDISYVFNPMFWGFSAFFTFSIFSLVDLLFWTSKKKWHRKKTIWVKLLLTVGGFTMMCTCIPVHDNHTVDNDIIRGVAVITVSLSWIYLMIYLTWTPTLGYYMQMYGKVFENVIKVMLSFSFPLVGFSICFMILLRAEEPFDGPISAFLKTLVMMSSEFEYENLVKSMIDSNSTEDAKNSTRLDSYKICLISVYMLRIFFLLFLISVAIVLMNLMLSVAVTDLQELSHDSKQRRLMKQVECISLLEKLLQQWPFCTFKIIKMKTMKVPSKVEVNPDSNIFGREMKEIILNKAQSLIENKEKKADDVGMKAKIDDIFYLTKKLSDFEKKLYEMTISVTKIAEAVALKDNASEIKPAKCESIRTRRGPHHFTKLNRTEKAKKQKIFELLKKSKKQT